LASIEKELQQEKMDNTALARPPSCMQEVGSSNCRRTAPTPSFDIDDSVEMWVVAPPPPPPTCLAPSPPPPPTHVQECPHIKEVSSYEHYF
jgi:hypothetical protein